MLNCTLVIGHMGDKNVLNCTLVIGRMGVKHWRQADADLISLCYCGVPGWPHIILKLIVAIAMYIVC